MHNILILIFIFLTQCSSPFSYYIVTYTFFFKKITDSTNLENINFPTTSHNLFIKSETGDERIELPPKVLETPIIPFDQSPRYNYRLPYLK